MIRQITKPVLIAIIIFFFIVLKDILIEMIGGKLGDYLQQQYPFITTTRLFYGLITVLLITLLFAIYEAIKSKPKKDEVLKVSEKELKSDLTNIFDSLLERYSKRYQNKLDGAFEITLEVSNDFDAPKPQSISEQFGEDATKGEATLLISKEFENKGRLLVCGNPGVGKTLLLLKLAISLLNNIENVEKEPLPIVFNLASWSTEFKDFSIWLSLMLVSGYGLSKAFAETLLRENRVVFLLAGLDELAKNETDEKASKIRAECLASINDFLNNGRKAVISSRINEYLFTKKKQKQDAPVSTKVRILNLTKNQVLNSLKEAKNHENFTYKTSATNLLGILEKTENDKLLSVLRTPYYFTTAIGVFDRQLINNFELPNTHEKIRKLLIDKFVRRKVEYLKSQNTIETQKTHKWLKWLAQLMEKKQLISFQLSDLDVNDLKTRWFLAILLGLFCGLIMGILGSVFGVIGMILGLLVAFTIKSGDLVSTEDLVTLDFSKLLKIDFWSEIADAVNHGTVSGIMAGWMGFIIDGPRVGVFVGIVGVTLFSLMGILLRGFQMIKQIKNFTFQQNPYQRILGGLSVNILFYGTLFLILILIAILLGYSDNGFLRSIPKLLWLVIVSGIVITSITLPFIGHLFLRICLWIEKSIPIKYVTFLNACEDIGILERDGGHWRFRHQNLQEYFANLD